MAPRPEAFAPQLIYISAGSMPTAKTTWANLGLVEADYEWVTRQLLTVANRHCQGASFPAWRAAMLSALARSVAAHVKVSDWRRLTMDKHYLTPLFTPQSIAVFANHDHVGRPNAPGAGSAGRTEVAALRGRRHVPGHSHQRHTVHTDLAQARADLAHHRLATAGHCIGAGTGRAHGMPQCVGAVQRVGAELAGALKKIARREGVHLLAPTAGFAATAVAAQCPVAGGWPCPARWRWCRSRGS